MSTPRSFDEYSAEHNVQPHELGQAFAAYLHEISGGEWDGDVEQVHQSAGAAPPGEPLEQHEPDDHEPQ